MHKRNYLIFCLLAMCLVGCSRQQQGVDTIFNREKPANFTTLQSEAEAPKIQVPSIPGKAVIAGAPFVDYQTQTGSAATSAQSNQAVPTIPQ